MKHLLTYKLYEKSSLTYLGVPEEVMQDIQKQFALSDDAQWRQLRFKKDLRTELRKDDSLFVIISEDKKQITVVFLVDGILYVDNYQYYQADDMGDEYWDKEDRRETNVTEVNKLITRGSDIYKLILGDWTTQIRAKRRIKKKTEEFNDFTINFKKDFADNFTRIIKKLYKRNAHVIQKIVMQKLITQNKNIDPELAKEVLLGFQDDAKRAEFFRKRGEEKDPFKLQLQFIRDNSLTIFNEYLISFEDDMSRKYGEFTNIQKLSEKYTREKIMTAFMYYLYSGKLMELEFKKNEIFGNFFKKGKKENPIKPEKFIKDVKDVELFDKWLFDKYGGIIGRIDKLSIGMVSDYFKSTLGREVDLKVEMDFMEEIRKEWLSRRRK